MCKLQAAVAYNDQSINENMHAAAGFKLLAKKENNFLSRWVHTMYWVWCAQGVLGVACAAAPKFQRWPNLKEAHERQLGPTAAPPHRLSEEDFRCVRRLVIRIILGTDMARHHDSVEDFTAALRLWGPDLGAWAPDKRVVALQVGRWVGGWVGGLRPPVLDAIEGREGRLGASASWYMLQWREAGRPRRLGIPAADRSLLLPCSLPLFFRPQLLVHAADISNPARPLRHCCEWGRKVHEEFFAQGERAAGGGRGGCGGVVGCRVWLAGWLADWAGGWSASGAGRCTSSALLRVGEPLEHGSQPLWQRGAGRKEPNIGWATMGRNSQGKGRRRPVVLEQLGLWLYGVCEPHPPLALPTLQVTRRRRWACRSPPSATAAAPRCRRASSPLWNMSSSPASGKQARHAVAALVVAAISAAVSVAAPAAAVAPAILLSVEAHCQALLQAGKRGTHSLANCYVHMSRLAAMRHYHGYCSQHTLPYTPPSMGLVCCCAVRWRSLLPNFMPRQSRI